MNELKAMVCLMLAYQNDGHWAALPWAVGAILFGVLALIDLIAEKQEEPCKARS